MSEARPVLRLRKLWLAIGYGLIVFVVYETLTSHPIDLGVHVSDKYMHTVGYFALMGWFMQLYATRKGRLFWAVFFVAMGITLEFLQELGGVRYFEVNDMLANGLGVIIAGLLSFTTFSKLLFIIEKQLFRFID
jgi:VanZ family protein